jgi:hydroxyacylglutathione hydrolase
MFAFATTSAVLTSLTRGLRAPLGRASCSSARSRWLSMAQGRAAPMNPIPLGPTVDVFIVPVLSDNFAYLIHDKLTNVAAVVDPVAPQALLDLADKLGATVTTALVTHRHMDHAGGNAQLAGLRPGVEIVGSAYETAPAVNVLLEHEEMRIVKDGRLAYRALHTPCHTNGHLCFVTDTPKPAVFCGDTLFIAGCGRFFEGTATDMHRSLNTTLASLPDECLVFCGHEYTVANLEFAKSVDPHNKSLQQKLEWARMQIATDRHTVPSTIGEEKKYNPFMRPHVAEIAAAVGKAGRGPDEVLDALRSAKNAF